MTDFYNIWEMVDEMNEIATATVRETMTACSAEDLGLDHRAGYHLFVNRDCVAMRGRTTSLDYYGGFEYVDSEYVQVVGDWKFYFCDDERVQDHIDAYYDRQTEEEECY